jgi:ATP-dependent DNA helicase RecG
MAESQNVEYKENWKDEYLKTIAAFANSQGGKLYVGIDDNGQPVGVKNFKKILENLPNKIKNHLLITPLINLETINEKNIILIEIFPSSFPIFYSGKIFVRSGSTTQELTGIELSSFLLEKTGQTWDKLPTDTEDNEIDSETIDKFIKISESRLPLIKDLKDEKLLLKKLQLYTKDDKLNRAAVILFAKNPQMYFPSAYVKVGRFKTETEIIDTVIIDGNLFKQLDDIIKAIKKHINVRFDTSVKDLNTESLSRRDIWDYPLDALREAVINALVHRDYLGSAPIQIKIYDDRISIWNLGKLLPPLSIESLKQPHSGYQRNPQIATMFYYAGLIEAWGSGTLKMIELCKKQNLPEPQFIENAEGIGDFTVVFNKDIYTEEYLRKMGLNDRQIKAAMYVKEKGKITNSEYKKINNTTKITASRDLSVLVIKGILEQIGGTGKGTHYILTKNNL